jgi:hypothetical protein
MFYRHKGRSNPRWNASFAYLGGISGYLGRGGAFYGDTLPAAFLNGSVIDDVPLTPVELKGGYRVTEQHQAERLRNKALLGTPPAKSARVAG